MTTKKAQAEAERQEAIAELREMLPPGTTVYTILRHVSSSGMMRVIEPVIVVDGKVLRITWLVLKALERSSHKKYDGVVIGGCGSDMGFEIVYHLGSVLYPNGFDCAGSKCQGNDHFNRVETNHHRDGGYALEHRWL